MECEEGEGGGEGEEGAQEEVAGEQLALDVPKRVSGKVLIQRYP